MADSLMRLPACASPLQGRGRSPWNETVDAALTLSAFYADGLPLFRRIPPSKQQEVVAVNLAIRASNNSDVASTGPGGGGAQQQLQQGGRAAGADPPPGSVPWRAAVLSLQRVAFEVLAMHAGIDTAAGGSESITAGATGTGRTSGTHPGVFRDGRSPPPKPLVVGAFTEARAAEGDAGGGAGAAAAHDPLAPGQPGESESERTMPGALPPVGPPAGEIGRAHV